MSIPAGETAPLLPLDANNSGASRRHLGVTSLVFLNINRIIGTGIFSIPSSIYQLTGSVGWSMAIWVFGGILSSCGFTVYLEYGLQMPHSGGDKNYLDRVYTWPPRLMLTIFAVCQVIISFSTSNSYAFGNYSQLVWGVKTPDETCTRWIASFTIGSVCFLHARYPRAGRALFNYLGFAKTFVLVLIAACGPLLALGILEGGSAASHNFGRHMWTNDGFGGGPYEIGVALIRVAYSYRGWETANLVMSEVKDPERTVIRAGIIGLSTITALYTMCTYAYFAVIPKEEVAETGVIIAGVFCRKLFGESAAARVLPFVICLSNFGNLLVVTYAASRVTQEIGRHHILPGSSWLETNKPWGAPSMGLFMHFFMTILTLLLPPPGDVYNFVVDVSTYPMTIFASLVTAGLFAVHRNPARWNWNLACFRAPTAASVLFFATNLVMVVFPWMPPPTKKVGLPYYASTAASLLVMGLGAVYWYFCKDFILKQTAPVLE